MKRKEHEIKDLLYNLAGDEELPKSPTASERSRKHVDKIVEKMNQEKAEIAPVPKPVYSKPPKHKRIVTPPEPVSHFSEEPSQNPVVRMHDRLLEDAMPKPDSERKPTKIIENKAMNKSSKKKIKSNSDSQPKVSKNSKKHFRIEIKEDLPPDIPRDTSIADQIRQEQLEKTLASVPPKTSEQIRKEQVRKRAAKIREQMKKQSEAVKQPEIIMQVQEPEPEPEDMQSLEDKFSELSEKDSSEEFQQVFEDAQKLESPVLADMPEIPEMSSEDTSFLKITEELKKEMLSEENNASSEINESPEKSKQQAGFLHKFFKNIFQRDVQKIDTVPEINKNVNSNAEPLPEITEVLLTPKESNKPDLSFEQTAILQTVKIAEQQNKQQLNTNLEQGAVSELPALQPKWNKNYVIKQEPESIIEPKITPKKKKSFTTEQKQSVAESEKPIAIKQEAESIVESKITPKKKKNSVVRTKKPVEKVLKAELVTEPELPALQLKIKKKVAIQKKVKKSEKQEVSI